MWLVFALGRRGLAGHGRRCSSELFRRTFGFDEKHLPLFVFMAGSPFFLKNFMHTLGHFDIYGCLLAICLLLIPARSLAFVLLAALFSIVLVLIHHIHLLMYVPTIAVIVVLRYYLVHGFTGRNVAVGIAALAAVGLLFVAAQFYGTMTVPETEFVAYLQSRMADPSRTEPAELCLHLVSAALEGNLAIPGHRMPSQPAGRAGVRAADLAACAALAIFSRSDRARLPIDSHRRIVIAAIVVVSLGYLVMFAIVFDYSRWISNWAVCLFLILHAVKTLPASNGRAADLGG